MSDTKYLNLDEVAPKAERVVRLNKKEYPIVLQTVGAFINAQKKIEEIDKLEDEAQKMDAYVDMLCMLIPSMKRDLLLKLTFEQLQALTEFARGEVDEEVREEMASQTASEEAELDDEAKKS